MQNYYQRPPYRPPYQNTDNRADNSFCAVEDNRECFPLAMAYVPWQKFQNTFSPSKALMCGTIFEELYKPFLGKGGRRL